VPIRLLRQIRHEGVSFVKGSGLLHLWICRPKAADPERLERRWKRFVVEFGIGNPLIFGEDNTDTLHAWAECSRYLSPPLVRDIAEGLDADDARLLEEMEAVSLRQFAYENSFGLYHSVAKYRGWVSLPAILGGAASLFLGIGRHTQLRIMNMKETVSSVMAVAGMDKAFCRGLLNNYGIAVPPSALVSSVGRTVHQAEELGYPVALKKVYGGDSAGVILDLKNLRECKEAAEFFFGSESSLILEKMLSGIELRLHFIDGKLAYVFHARAETVTGDGQSSLAALLETQDPDYYRHMQASTEQRRRLILLLWNAGVRDIGDVARIVPAAGQVVRVSTATRGRMQPLEFAVVHPDDRRALEDLFRRYGCPSAGVDAIVREKGARFSDGGGVLEINVPSGFSYMSLSGIHTPIEAARAVDLELLHEARSARRFLSSGGRVPVWLVSGVHFPEDSSVRRELLTNFKRFWPRGQVDVLQPERGWLPILTHKNAHAFLIWVSDAAITQHGMPHHLRPVVVHSVPFTRFKKEFAALVATARNAGGRFRPYPTLWRKLFAKPRLS